LHNGFSFGAHLLDADYHFIKISDDKKEVKEVLKKYDRVYASCMLYEEANYLEGIVDERWVLGGPAITSKTKGPYWKNVLKPAILVDDTFEHYIGMKETSDIFTPYYISFVEKISPKLLRMASICDKRCSWGNCSFCTIRWNWANAKSEGTFGRDVEKVLKQLPNFDNTITNAYISCGSTDPKVLETVIQSKYKKPNYVYQFQTRFDEETKKVIEKADDLSQFVFGVGLEYPSQDVINELNKGLNVETELSTLKLAVKKGAKILLFILTNIPFLTYKSLYEGMTNIDWIFENIPLLKTDGRIYFDDTTFSNVNNLNNIDYMIKDCKGIAIANFDIVWQNEVIAKKYGPYSEVSTGYGGKVYVTIMNEEQKYLNSLFKERLKKLYPIEKGNEFI